MVFLNNFYEIKLRFQDFMSCVYGRMHLADYIHLWFLEIVFIRGRCSKREGVYWKIYRTGKSIWILYIYIDPKIENKTLDPILVHDILGAYKYFLFFCLTN